MSAQQQAELQECLRQSQQNGTASALATLAPAAISALQSFLNTHGCPPLLILQLRHLAAGLAEHACGVAHGQTYLMRAISVAVQQCSSTHLQPWPSRAVHGSVPLPKMHQLRARMQASDAGAGGPF